MNYKKEKGMDLPLVVRMTGTNDAEGKRILTAGGIPSLDSMDKSAQAIVDRVGGKA